MSPLWALREFCHPGTATCGGSGPSPTLPFPVTLSFLRHPQDGQRLLTRREPRMSAVLPCPQVPQSILHITGWHGQAARTAQRERASHIAITHQWRTTFCDAVCGTPMMCGRDVRCALPLCGADIPGCAMRRCAVHFGGYSRAKRARAKVRPWRFAVGVLR